MCILETQKQLDSSFRFTMRLAVLLWAFEVGQKNQDKIRYHTFVASFPLRFHRKRWQRSVVSLSLGLFAYSGPPPPVQLPTTVPYTAQSIQVGYFIGIFFPIMFLESFWALVCA